MAEAKINVKEQLSALRKQLEARAGETGFNPFIFLRDNVAPLEEELAKGGNDESVAKKLAALKVPAKAA